jgi:hypothetical protein
MHGGPSSYAYSNADAQSTIDTLVLWFSTFTICGVWVSEQASKFINRVFIALSTRSASSK